MSYKYSIKYIIIGDEGVGKTSILVQFIDERFQLEELGKVTVGAELNEHMVVINTVPLNLVIWDTSGRKIYRSLAYKCFHNTAVVFLVYDITRRDSFENLESWLADVDAKQHSKSKTTIVIIGNKSDLEENREVTKEEGETFAKKNGLMFMESSAKIGHNIQHAFLSIANNIYTDIHAGVLEVKKENGIKFGPQVRSSLDSNNGLSGNNIDTNCCCC